MHIYVRNVYVYVCVACARLLLCMLGCKLTYVCMKLVCMYVCMHLCMYLCMYAYCV